MTGSARPKPIAGRARNLTGDLVMHYGDAITRLPDGMKTEEDWRTDTLVYLDRRSREADDDRGFKDEIAMACSRLADLCK